MPESIFDRKGRVRPPRVHITYEVETGGARVLKEIPFVLAVLADLSGHPAQPLPKLRERKFTELDRDGFDDVLRASEPRLALRVENRLRADGSELPVELRFSRLDDFRPENVVKQVPELALLQQVRNELKDLLGRLEGNDRLAELLQGIAASATAREKLRGALALAAGSPAGEE
jgi:type VI secretion system protein ImpB